MLRPRVAVVPHLAFDVKSGRLAAIFPFLIPLPDNLKKVHYPTALLFSNSFF